jgi:hypothetical protein
MATTATTDEDLSQLEKDIRQFKIEYEQYFGGGKTRPPNDTEWRIDTMMKRYGDRGGQMNFSQRYRYNNLAQTYVKYREFFRKRLKKREEGTQEHHFGATAREIEAERARKKAAEAKAGIAKEFPFIISCKDLDHEKKKVEQLYSALRRAKEQAGEGTEKLSLVAFQTFLRQKTDLLKKQRGAHEVEYVVTIEGKHARLKARVKT